MSCALFNWLHERSIGVLAHISSLPSPQGIGNFGSGAYSFIDFMAEANIGLWQICPLGPISYGDSPYQSYCSFALNPYFIDLEKLTDLNAITAQELEPLKELPQTCTDYGALYHAFWPILEKVATKFFNNAHRGDLHLIWKNFLEKNHDWLEPYCAFMALKERYEGKHWINWPEQFRNYSKAKQSSDFEHIVAQGQKHALYQCIAFHQWEAVRTYANRKAIQIIGDIPIFVASDSMDVWANPELFDLNLDGSLAQQAGVPPDCFSEDGQLWGNPVYNWQAHAKNNYTWWLKRIKSNLDLYDIIRLDHFRGFESYWSVPAEEKTACNGKWLPGPGLPFFETIKQAFPHCKFIAEDLGGLTPEVQKLLQDTGLPGMSILQFAFNGDNKNVFLPHNTIHNQVVYPGTHDNDTILGWYRGTCERTRQHAQSYLGINGNEINWDFIRAAYRSVARMAIISMQDFLNLDSQSRMNTPGTAQGNWSWRFTNQDLDKLRQHSAQYLRELSALYAREPLGR